MQRIKRVMRRSPVSEKFACTLLSAFLFCMLSLLCAGDLIALFTKNAEGNDGAVLLSYPQQFGELPAYEEETPAETAPEPSSEPVPETKPETQAPQPESSAYIPKKGDLPVQTVSLVPVTNSGYLLWNNIHAVNQTKYALDLGKLMKQPVKLSAKKKGKPEVLIIHTHTTESYSPKGAAYYSSGENNRSTDPSQNVVAVGDAFAQALEASGIQVIHDATINDQPDFNAAYTSSAKLVEATLKKYPSIRAVIDIHRDSVINASGVKYRPLTALSTGSAAQAMIVVGTDANGKSHKSWRENLKFALEWADTIEKKSPGLTRPILISKNRYNEHFTTGSLILEVGAAGNCIDEAKLSATLCAKSLAEILKS